MRIGLVRQIGKAVLAIFACGAFYGSSISTASACIIPLPFAVQDMDEAEMIFRGRIKTYRKLSNDTAGASLSFLVLDTFKGPREPLTRTALWRNSTFGVPEDLSAFTELYGHEFIVGLAPRYLIPEPNREELDRHWILQGPCRPPFMFGVNDIGVTSVMFGDRQENLRVGEALRVRGLIE